MCLLAALASIACGALTTTASATDRVQRAQQRFADRTGAYIEKDRRTGAVASMQRTDGFLSAPSRASAENAALRWLQEHRTEFGLDEADLAQLRLRSAQRTADGVTHLRWAQTARGIDSFNTALLINVARDGRIVNAGGSPVSGLEIESARPAVAAPAAGARLVVFADPAGDHLAWQHTARTSHGQFLVITDARTGQQIRRISLTDEAVNASVFENFPSALNGGSQETQNIESYLSPGFTQLEGPTALVYADLDDTPADSEDLDAGEQISPSGGGFQYTLSPIAAGSGQFCPTAFGTDNCTWQGLLNSSRATNRSQRGTQLFYFLNRFHDWLAGPDIGFDDFEGVSSRVIGQFDDGDGVDCDHLNNANMSTPPAGQRPLMQMYFFGSRSGCGSAPAVSSADDASVVYHEYTHGLSNRLIGDGSGLRHVQGRAMGEGWSDWYALDFLAENGFEADTTADGELVVGQYVTNDPDFGIRRAALDCSVGSQLANCQPISSTAGPGGYTFGDFGKIGSNPAEEHDNGEIWAQTLWDLRGALGPSLARTRITDAMRLTTTAEPGFLDMRNAIVAADLTAGGAQLGAIWAVFAARGMGCGASSPGSDSLSVTPAFDLPANGQSCAPASTAITAKAAPPVVSIGPLTSTVRLDRKGRFKLRFTATPHGSTGRLVIRSSRTVKVSGRKRTLLFASRSFGIGSSGLVDVQITVPKSVLKAVTKLKKVKATASFTIAGQSFSRGLTIKRP